MDNAIRLYFDESVEVAVTEQLRRRGIDVVNVRGLGLLGDTDINHLKRATEMGRVLCTYDQDFLRIAAEGTEHGGIIFAFQDRTSVGDWVNGMELVCKVYSPEDMKNQVEYL